MISRTLLYLTCLLALTSAWSLPYYPAQRGQMRYTRFAPPPPHHLRPHLHPPALSQHRMPGPVDTANVEEPPQQRPKRGHDDYEHHHRHGDNDHRGSSGITGPVHTFVKTDKNANYKWGVRHHVGDKFAS